MEARLLYTTRKRPLPKQGSFVMQMKEVLLFFLLGKLRVVIDGLGIVVILQPVDQLLHLGHGFLVRQLGGGGGNHLALGGEEHATGLLQFVAHAGEVVGVGVDDGCTLAHFHVVRAAIQGQHGQLVLVHALGVVDLDDALALELPGDAAARTQGTAALVEDVADFACGAVQVIGDDLNDHGDAAGSISLVGDLLVVGAVALAGGLLDGALNVVVGHVGGLRLCDDVLQLAVQIGIRAAAGLYGDHDFAADLGKDLALCSIRLGLFILDGRPFVMS